MVDHRDAKAKRIWPQDSLNVHMAQAVRDLQAPWNTRSNFDRRVLGAIEVAFLRGAQHVIPPIVMQDLARIDTILSSAAPDPHVAEAREWLRKLLMTDEIVITSTSDGPDDFGSARGTSEEQRKR